MEEAVIPKSKFWVFFDRLIDFMAVLAGVLVVFITAAECYTIGMRFLFTKTTIWVVQTNEYALLWIIFLGTAWLLREGGHITTDVVYVHLNEKTKQYLNVIMFVVGGLTCATLAFFGILYLCNCILRGVTDVRAVTIPKWIVFLIIPVGSILLTVQFFRMAWSRLIDIRRGR